MKLAIAPLAVLAVTSAASSTFIQTCGGTTPEVEDCSDGIDNDHDLEVDCTDSDCFGGRDLLLTEIQMAPTKVPDVDGEYLEFTNFGDTCVDMSKWSIAEDSGLPATILPSNSLVKPGYTYVLAGTFYADDNCGVYANAATAYDSTLNDDHDAIIVKDATGALVMRIDYCNGTTNANCVGAWPKCAAGAAMEYCGAESLTDNADGTHWECATAAYGCGDLGSPKLENGCGL